jgi:hypothetical protein
MKRSTLVLTAMLAALALLMALALGNLEEAKSAAAQPSSGLQVPTPTPTPVSLGQLKVCKIARPGVTPGTIFTINVNGTPYSVPGARSPGLCVLAGQFPLNTQVTVQEVIPAGYVVSAIQVHPDNRQVSKDVTVGRVVVKIGTGVTEVVYVDKVSGLLSSSSRQAAGAQEVTGRLEICKEADGAGVTGNFTFTFAGKTRTIPVGACTPLIVVPVGPLTITEGARAGYEVSDIYTIPSDRLISENLSARSATVTIVQGRASTQTIVVFRNRTQTPP